MDQHTTIEINENTVPSIPHNGEPITKFAVSPQLNYVVTYSQKDKSFVGWYNNNKNSRFCFRIDRIFIKIDRLVFNKDSQEDEPSIKNSEQFIVDNKVQQYKLLDLDILDFKVSDEKVIMYEGNDKLATIYDMKHQKEITLHSGFKKYLDSTHKFNLACYEYTNFLATGDLVTCKKIFETDNNQTKSVILFYSSNTTKDNKWICKSVYELNKMNGMEINFGGITDNKLWMFLNKTVFKLDLFTFQYREIIETNEDVKTINFSKSITDIINVDGIHYIYSNRMDALIKSIVESDSINYNNSINSFLDINKFDEKPWEINMKKRNLESYILDNNSIGDMNVSEESNHGNIFDNRGKQFKDEIEFIKKNMIPYLEDLNEYQNEYDMRSLSDKGEIILEAFIKNSSKNEIVASYNTNSNSWKDIKVNNNTYILCNATELRIYTFNMKSKNIRFQCCYNIKFLKYAIKLYSLKTLEIEEIKEIAQPTDNDGLKKQWILHVTSQNSFLVHYGEKLLKSAIKQNNIELIETIFNKILEYFKENPKNNIYILSILCRNMPYLNQEHPEFLSKYYSEMNLFIDSSNSSMIYNNLQHLYSFCKELKVTKVTFVIYFLRPLYISTIKTKLLSSKFLEELKFLKVFALCLTMIITVYSSILLYIILPHLFGTIIILLSIIIWKRLKFVPELLLMIGTCIVSEIHSPRQKIVDIIILILLRLFWKSPPLSLILLICVASIVADFIFIGPSELNIMLIMVTFIRQYWKSHSKSLVLLFLIYMFRLLFYPGVDIFYIFLICIIIRIYFINIIKPRPKFTFIVPFPSYMTYPEEYNWFKELLIKPKSSPFSQICNNELYKTWNGEAIINFKWRVFGRYYYAAIWILFIIYCICFILASVSSDSFINKIKIGEEQKEGQLTQEEDPFFKRLKEIGAFGQWGIFSMAIGRKNLIISSIILGSIHLLFEVRQFIWNPIIWISNIWNLFDLGAFLMPVITSIYWINKNTENTQLVSISCLLLGLKFLLFFRAFESFGTYFAIIIGVAKRIASFLFIILIITFSFALAFFILLKPKSNFSEHEQGDLNDQNNPWVLTKKYHQISEDGNMTKSATLIEEPDETTNLFSSYTNSLLSMYLFLTGDRNSLSAWSPNDNSIMIILMIIFSFVVVVFLMNLFIGLLNMAIEADNDRASYLAQKAEILKEIELFYLLPHQRRWKAWFPDIIYYYANVDKTRQAVRKLMNEEAWKIDDFPETRKNLLKCVGIEN